MKRRRLKYSAAYVDEQRQILQQWNRKCPPGTPVTWSNGTLWTTKGRAFLLGGHTTHVALAGKVGSVYVGSLQPKGVTF